MTNGLDHAKNTLAVAEDLKKLMIKHKIQYIQLDDYGKYIDFNGTYSHLSLDTKKSLTNKNSFITVEDIDDVMDSIKAFI